MGSRARKKERGNRSDHCGAKLTSMPSRTVPKTACLPSSQGVFTVVMKNWLPCVLGPAEEGWGGWWWWSEGRTFF